MSTLGIGELGRSQAATFIVTSLPALASFLGVQRSLGPEGAPNWVPQFFAAAAIGLIGPGLFVTNPMNSYPPGRPLVPLQYSPADRLHRLFSSLFFLSVALAAFHRSRCWL